MDGKMDGIDDAGCGVGFKCFGTGSVDSSQVILSI